MLTINTGNHKAVLSFVIVVFFTLRDAFKAMAYVTPVVLLSPSGVRSHSFHRSRHPLKPPRTAHFSSLKSHAIRDTVDTPQTTRRSFFQQSTTSAALLLPLLGLHSVTPDAAHAATVTGVGNDLPSNIYYILRAREAIEQETRLIKTGKFKDVQRANVKLAVKFISQNYRLSDNLVGASAYLQGDRSAIGGAAAQKALQSLVTILEYFDSADVQNLKVDNLAGKEALVLKGLDSAKKSIDEFLNLFPGDIVAGVSDKIKEENELNYKEFDTSLGTIINPNPQKI